MDNILPKSSLFAQATTPLTAPSTTSATDPLDRSFDLVARADQAEADIAELRTDVDEVRKPGSTRFPGPPPGPRSERPKRRPARR